MISRVLAGMALLATAVSAQTANGPRAPILLELPSGTRTLALGNTGIGSRDDDVIFFNPAQLANANGMSVSGEWLSSTAGTGALSAVTRFNNGGIGIGMRLANYELPPNVFPATRATMLEPGDAAAGSMEAVIGFAQSMKGVRAGIAAKYTEDVVNSHRLGRPLADVGVAKDFFRTTFGLSVQNIGKNIDLVSVDLPLRTTFGAYHARSIGPYDFVFTGAVSMIRDAATVQGSGGVELNYSWLSGYNVALRGGWRSLVTGEEPFTAGAGITVDRVSVDYALETLSNQRVGHRFGVRVR